MKVCLFYYSGSGNTKLACQYIARNASSMDFVLSDIIRDKVPDLDPFDMIGFATFADYLGPSKAFADFVNSLPMQHGKPSFVLSTFGYINGATLRIMSELAASRGFVPLTGHALHMPENIPTMICAGNANEQAPDKNELADFKRFVAGLNDLGANSPGQTKTTLRFSFRDRLYPKLPRTLGRMIMGKKHTDPLLCSRCGICAGVCPYKAVTMDELPQFDQKKCYGCWACYNHCPPRAIYTRSYRGRGHYPEPLAILKEKLPI